MPVPFFVGEWNFFANFGNEWLHLHPDKFTRYPICSSLKVNSNLDRETIFRVRCVVPVPISNGRWSKGVALRLFMNSDFSCFLKYKYATSECGVSCRYQSLMVGGRKARNRPGRRPRPCLRRPSRTSSVDGWPPVRHQLAVCVWFGTWAVFCENFGAEHYERRVGAEFVMRKKSRWVDLEEAAGVDKDGEEHLGRCLDHRDRHGEAGPGAQLWGVRWEWFGFCCFVFTFW